jgi:hypothetical protein
MIARRESITLLEVAAAIVSEAQARQGQEVKRRNTCST